MSTVVDATLLQHARANGWAIGAFNFYNLEQGLGILRGAEAEGLPVILQAGEDAFQCGGREPLAGLGNGLIKSATVPVGLHLDHARNLGEVDWALEAGFTSVMFDTAALLSEDAIALTREVVEHAHAAGAWVEGELPSELMTDPGRASHFAVETGIDALAVAVGNRHGIQNRAPDLDLDLLTRIATATPLPLVLHGGSGLSDTVVAGAIRRGVAKVNVNAELRRALRAALGESLRTGPATDQIAALMNGAIAASREIAQAKLRAFGNPSGEAEMPSAAW